MNMYYIQIPEGLLFANLKEIATTIRCNQKKSPKKAVSPCYYLEVVISCLANINIGEINNGFLL